MKTLLSVLVVLAMALSPLCADTTLLQENFDGAGAAAGNPINGYNGWSGSSLMVFSSTLVDSGLSAGVAGTGTEYPKVTKGFSHTPLSGEVYTLTATLLLSTTRMSIRR